jgi:hypothetical protein
MAEQASLFATDPKYCIDANVVLSFLKGSDDEHYGTDVFGPQWQFLERQMKEGLIIGPRQVDKELEAWEERIDSMRAWRREHAYLFRDIESDAQLDIAKRIVNAYPAYARNQNYLGDLELICLAGARELTVLSMEHQRSTQPSRTLPKIPDVCAKFRIDCVSFPGYLRREGFGAVQM